MRIAQISTLSSPVGRNAGGSVEAFVWLLTAELIRLGHEVTVFACAGSETDGELMATLPGPYGANGALDDWQLCEWVNLCRAVEHSDRFDVLHSHAYLWAIPLQALSRSPLVHTLHIVPDENAARLWSMAPGSHVTAISRYQWGGFPRFSPPQSFRTESMCPSSRFRPSRTITFVTWAGLCRARGPCGRVLPRACRIRRLRVSTQNGWLAGGYLMAQRLV